jgi:hypothetical protein
VLLSDDLVELLGAPAAGDNLITIGHAHSRTTEEGNEKQKARANDDFFSFWPVKMGSKVVDGTSTEDSLHFKN